MSLKLTSILALIAFGIAACSAPADPEPAPAPAPVDITYDEPTTKY